MRSSSRLHPRLRRFPVLASFCLIAAAPAGAQSESGHASWSQLDVPGTPAALAWAAGLDPQAKSLTPEWVLLETIRAIHGEPDTPLLRNVQDYLRLINAYEADRRALGDRVSLGLAADRQRREAFETFLETAGFGLGRSRRGEPEQVVRRTDAESADRRTLLTAAGTAIERLEARLNAGEEVTAASLAVPWFSVPLPLDREWWDATLGPGVDPFTAMVTDRRAALLFYGLSSLDADTRKYLVDAPHLVPELLRNASVFAAYGGHLRVRRGRIEVPGGDEAAAWWETLVGAPVTSPDQFITRLLKLRSGRTAYFYSLLDSIGEARVRFITGLSTPPATQPDDVFRAFDRSEPGFDPERRPFSRPVGDPALFLTELAVDPEGRPLGPSWRYLWDAVFDELRLPADATRTLRPAPATVDAPYWFGVLLDEGPVDSRVRMNAILFAQRVFDGASEDRVPDLLIALRGFQRFPMLCLTLERAGVTDPSVYRAAVRMADALSAVEHTHQAFASLSQFQGALALIEFGVRTRKISAEGAAALVESLASVPLDRHGSFGGDIARWMDTVLLPEVSTELPVSGAAPMERAFLAGLTNLAEVIDPLDPRGRGPVFEWEGWRYHVDPWRAAFARVTTIRQRQAGNSLDAILQLSRVTASLTAEVTLDSVAAQADLLRNLRAELREPQLPVATVGPRPLDVATALGQALQELGRVREKRHLRDVTRVAGRLHLLTAALTADLLRSLAYAVNVPDAQSPLFAAGDVSHQHDLGVEAKTTAEREGVAWGFPERMQGGPGSVRARGSLLGLDVAMADLSLGQTFLDRFELPANWTFEDLRIHVQVLAFFNPFDERLKQQPNVVAALRTGRERLLDPSVGPSDLDTALAAAGVPPLRRALIGLARERTPAAVEAQVSLAELLALAEREEAAYAANAWGASTLVLDGCLCLSLDPRVPWDLHSSRHGAWGFLGARSTDLLLHIAEALHTLNVPPEVAAEVLPLAMQLMLRRSRLAHADDWLSAVRDAVLGPADIAPLISQATAGRSLYPAAR
jgi:hypothetical protein